MRIFIERWQIKNINRDYRKAAEYYRNVLDLSPEDFDIRLKYADCLNELNLNKKQKKCFMKAL